MAVKAKVAPDIPPGAPGSAREMFYDDNGKKADALLHNEILDEGDDAAAQRESRAFLKKEGWTKERIEAFFAGKPKPGSKAFMNALPAATRAAIEKARNARALKHLNEKRWATEKARAEATVKRLEGEAALAQARATVARLSEPEKTRRWREERAAARAALARIGRVESEALIARADWDESEHPRDEDGKFASGGGGGGGGGGDSDKATGDAKPLKEGHAADLVKPVTETVDDVIAKVPGSQAHIDAAAAKYSNGVATDSLASKGGYKLPNGHWTAERQLEHARIYNKIMSPEKVDAARPKPGEQPVVHLLGGRGGSGKSWFTTPGKGTVDATKALVLNNDDVKEAFKEYAGWNAGLLHEESSEVGDAMEKTAREMGLNLIIDGTMKSPGSLAKRIEAYKKAGYRIEGHYMYTSPAESATRALKRFIGGNKKNGKGRYVRPEYSLTSTTNEASFDAVKGQMDTWEIYNNEGDAPVFHARGRKEKD